MSAPILLFSPVSLNHDSPIFQITGQKTIVAVGMSPDDVITFEIVLLSAGAPSSVCGCHVSQATPGVVVGLEPLLCPSCESDTLRPVRLTARNPVVVLDSPQDAFVRALYDGDGIDLRNVTVHAYETKTPDLTDAMRGCPPVCCEDDPQTWTDTGTRRCDAVNQERLEISNCGNYRWVVHAPIVWRDTGNHFCDLVGNVMSREQINNCGEIRWYNEPGDIVTWEATGEERCTSLGVERQEINPCGDTRWVLDRDLSWVETNEQRCTNGIVERQERNDCGALRWVNHGPLTWQPTGMERCTDTAVEGQETNNCGNTRWVILRAVSWQYTGAVRCTSITFEEQQINDCGLLRWLQTPILWEPTGNEECRSNAVFREEINQCGRIRWIDTGELCEVSTHTILSMTPVSATITEGQTAQWTVTLDGAVTGSPLVINFTLSGTEQVEHSYPAPTLTIPVGATVGVLSVATTDDTDIEATLELCATATLSGRVTSAPGSSCIDVLDNDTPTGDSTHTVVCITPPASTVEGNTMTWEIVLDSPVAGSDLVVTTVLSGSEQTIHGYLPPSVTIPIGASSGFVSVNTIDDPTIEGDQLLCLTVNTSARITLVTDTPCGI